MTNGDLYQYLCEERWDFLRREQEERPLADVITGAWWVMHPSWRYAIWQIPPLLGSPVVPALSSGGLDTLMGIPVAYGPQYRAPRLTADPATAPPGATLRIVAEKW